MSIFDMLNQKQQQYRAATGNRADTTKLPDGESRWRIYPTWRKGADLDNTPFWHDFGQHFVIPSWDGQGEKPKASVYVCVQKTFQKECPVCAQIEAGMAAATNPDAHKQLKKAKASGRVLVNAVRTDGAEPSKVHLLELAPSAFDSFTDGVRACHMDGQNVLSLDNGFDVIFNKSGTGLNTKYTAQIARTSTPANPALMDQLHNLDEYCQQEHNEGLQRMLTAVNNTRGMLGAPTASAPQQAIPEQVAAPQAIPEQVVQQPTQQIQQPQVAAAQPNVAQNVQAETVIEAHELQPVAATQPATAAAAQAAPVQQTVQTTVVEPAQTAQAPVAEPAYQQQPQQVEGGVPQPSPDDLDAILNDINNINV